MAEHGGETLILPAIDLTRSLTEDAYQLRYEACERRLHELQYFIHREKIPVIILFEGWDAAGKGGAIIRLDRALNPAAVSLNLLLHRAA